MPELPEVQIIIDDLNKKIKGDTIVDFESFWKKSIKGGSFGDFKKEIIGREILGARRIGKNMFIDLSGGKTIYIHLKMTGHLLVKPKHGTQSANREAQSAQRDYFDDKVNQYIRHIFYLETHNAKRITHNAKRITHNAKRITHNAKRGTQNVQLSTLKSQLYDRTLEFSDLRKFGKLVLTDTDKICDLPEISKLGVDAMSGDFTLKMFGKILDKKKKSLIGAVLMDQDLIAGIGNIYRSEILFEAGIMPNRKVSSLSEDDVKRIYGNIKTVLKKATELRGTSDSDYRDTSGAPGKMSEALKVYNREGEKCKKCGTIVKREKMGQRSVFFCPVCQK